MGYIRSILITVLLAYFSKQFYFWLVDMGVGVPYNNVYPGKCRIIPGVECGSEKIAVTSDGLAFITSGLRLLTACNVNYIQGRLYLFDFSHPEKDAVQLEIYGQSQFDLKSFEPHGMDIYEVAETNFVQVYVVNHANHLESVEVFLYNRDAPHKIEHKETIRDEKFVCLNDVAVASENKFFATNCLKYCHTNFLFSVMESLFHMKTANVLFYDNGNTKIIDDGGLLYNGIVLHNNHVLVASNGDGLMITYDRDENTNELSNRQQYFIGHHPDNIAINKETGEILVGTHKTTLPLLLATFNKSDLVGGTAIKLKLDRSLKKVEVEEILHDDGRKFVKGIASVVYYKGQYLFGSVYDKLGYCKVNNV